LECIVIPWIDSTCHIVCVPNLRYRGSFLPANMEFQNLGTGLLRFDYGSFSG